MIRRALLDAATRLYAERGGATWPVIAACAEVPVDETESVAGETKQRGIAVKVAKVTIHDMVRSGQLKIIGRDKPAGSRHWHAILAPVQAPTCEPSRVLDALLSEAQVFG